MIQFLLFRSSFSTTFALSGILVELGILRIKNRRWRSYLQCMKNLGSQMNLCTCTFEIGKKKSQGGIDFVFDTYMSEFC